MFVKKGVYGRGMTPREVTRYWGQRERKERIGAKRGETRDEDSEAQTPRGVGMM